MGLADDSEGVNEQVNMRTHEKESEKECEPTARKDTHTHKHMLNEENKF